MRDHGGNIDWAIEHFGGTWSEWIDLSTGINRVPYPLPPIAPESWHALPTNSAICELRQAAQQAYNTEASVLATAGAQAAIQMIPYLMRPGRARVLSPTYNEYAGSLRAASWHVDEVSKLQDLHGADLAIVANPNNPDGRRTDPNSLNELTDSVGTLVVDESFADADPEISVAPLAGRKGLLVLRSLGKFYGLAGTRLGFVLGCKREIDRLAEMAGPWPISGPAIQIGQCALRDDLWAEETKARLRVDARRLDELASEASWVFAGGTALFRLYETDAAVASRDTLAKAHIWSRIFPWSSKLIRLGLPGSETEWRRLSSAIQGKV